MLEALSDIFPTEFVKAYWFGARVKVGTTPLVITSVQPQSPAGQAGLKAGDAILQVNGKAPKSFIDFTDLLAASAGSEVTLAIRRGTARKEVAVRLVPEKSVFNAGMIRDKLGLNLEELTPQLAARYGVGAVRRLLHHGGAGGQPGGGGGFAAGHPGDRHRRAIAGRPLRRRQAAVSEEERRPGAARHRRAAADGQFQCPAPGSGGVGRALGRDFVGSTRRLLD